MSYIDEQVSILVNKHKTNNPFIIAENMGILILHEPLGSIHGYYNKYLRQKFIHINNELEIHDELFTCAHELSHAILHPDANTPFLRSNTLFSLDKLERQANIMASKLILYHLDISKYLNHSMKEIAFLENVDVRLLELKYY